MGGGLSCYNEHGDAEHWSCGAVATIAEKRPRREQHRPGGPVSAFYEGAGSLFVEAYDAFYSDSPPQIAGDVAFYEGLARQTSGPVLEVACGTGRIALALAAAGLEVTGVHHSDGMLTTAWRKVAALPAAARDRLTLVAQDMTELSLSRRFGFVFVAFRSFQHLLTIERQKRSLGAIRHHLKYNGRLALHLFDPRLDLL